MIATDYEKQAQDLLDSMGVKFEAIKSPVQTCPNWGKCESFKYSIGKKAVTVPHNHGAKFHAVFTRGKDQFVIDFWNSIKDTYDHAVKAYIKDLENNNLWGAGAFFDKWLETYNPRGQAIKPNAYDVLACISGDIDAHNLTFEEWASDYGYDSDSIKAKATYDAVCDQSRQMARFFTAEELDKIREIQ